MPVALDKPWKEIETLFTHGKSIPALAAQFSIHPRTIYARARRNGWIQPQGTITAKRLINSAVAQLVKEKIDESKPAIHAAVESWKASTLNVAGRLLKTVDTGVSRDSNTSRDLANLASALDQADRVGRRALGIDDDLTGQSIQVNLGLQILTGANDTSTAYDGPQLQHGDQRGKITTPSTT